MLSLPAFLRGKSAAVIANFALGAFWTICISGVRFFYPEAVKEIIWFQATFVFYAFFLSFGFSTLIRIKIYEGSEDSFFRLMILASVIYLLIAAFCMVFSGRVALVISFSCVYNLFFIAMNWAVARKEYDKSIALVFVLLVIQFASVFVYICQDFYVFKMAAVALFLMSIYFFFKAGSHLFNGNPVSYLLGRKCLSEYCQGPNLLISVLPLRFSIYLVGIYFSSEVASDLQSKTYADLLIYFGIISAFVGRFFLFNEVKAKEAAQGSYLPFVLFQLLVASPFIIYSCYFGDAGLVMFTAASLLFSSREIYGLHVNFLQNIKRWYLVFSYLAVVGVCFIGWLYFESFEVIVPVCIYFTFYYLFFRPLRAE